MAKSKKTVKISSKTAIVLSALFLVLCVLLLALTVVFTVKTQSAEEVKVEKRPPVSALTEESQEIEIPQLEDAKPVKASPVQEFKPAAKESAKPKKQAVSKETKIQNENKAPKNGKKIYIVLDDGGHNLSQLQYYLDLPFPLAIAVLPRLAHSEDSAAKIASSGKVLMLHQPMQAINRSTDPGPGAIEPELGEDQIKLLLQENIDQLNRASSGKLIGCNNHEGSLITENPELMKIVMKVCKSNNLFFLDSRTNSKSVCRSVAKDVGISLYERNIFLDNSPDEASMTVQFRKGIEIADKNGSVIMIGHVWSGKNLADVLQKMYSEYSSQGYEFVSF
ncbi:MAG: divergent polysaccharide deacetylase family protein [Treponemataceae bacterium]|nr:divergent polysaccharide deacetylase family protein [Treponemataceae bacterium]